MPWQAFLARQISLTTPGLGRAANAVKATYNLARMQHASLQSKAGRPSAQAEQPPAAVAFHSNALRRAHSAAQLACTQRHACPGVPAPGFTYTGAACGSGSRRNFAKAVKEEVKQDVEPLVALRTKRSRERQRRNRRGDSSTHRHEVSRHSSGAGAARSRNSAEASSPVHAHPPVRPRAQVVNSYESLLYSLTGGRSLGRSRRRVSANKIQGHAPDASTARGQQNQAASSSQQQTPGSAQAAPGASPASTRLAAAASRARASATDHGAGIADTTRPLGVAAERIGLHRASAAASSSTGSTGMLARAWSALREYAGKLADTALLSIFPGAWLPTPSSLRAADSTLHISTAELRLLGNVPLPLERSSGSRQTRSEPLLPPPMSRQAWQSATAGFLARSRTEQLLKQCSQAGVTKPPPQVLHTLLRAGLRNWHEQQEDLRVEDCLRARAPVPLAVSLACRHLHHVTDHRIANWACCFWGS
jgi:hypothetical protein